MKQAFNKKKINGGWLAFGWALLLSCAIFVPLMIYNDGYFLFLGDFNVQQIPFYKMAHEMVRSGNVLWNWRTDLGANFIGSYSFYLLFSPFFWLTLPFPTDFVPHLMAPLLILKTSCAALTGYLYIKRFVKDRDWAVVGSILYAFSGFMIFNIFFNHFHEPCVFFPLLLIALEELVTNDRRGFFAAMVALNCFVNYWFFIGEVVFVVIYVIVRMATGGWGCSVQKFIRIVLESMIGVGIACVALIPSAMAIMGNPRTGTTELINGWRMWIYGWEQRLPSIIQSFFFPPELPSRPNFFPNMGAKWASLSAWLPLFSCTGVIAFCASRRRNFHKRMIIISMIMALVPVFNSAFVMFNNSYYARWFYMPVLMMCVATASALQERNEPKVSEAWGSGWRWCAGFIAVISAAVAFSPVLDESSGELTFGLYGDRLGFLLNVFAALFCLLLLAAALFLLPKSFSFKKTVCVMLSIVTVCYTGGYLFSGKGSKANDDWIIKTAINGKVELPENLFARSDLYDSMDNLGMFWGLPNIQAFHSIVPPSIMEFYPSVGIKRDVSSKPSTEYDALRSLLSVRWLFVKEGEECPMPDFFFYDNQLGYDIYENGKFIPMGFAYDAAISREVAEELSGEQHTRHMLTAVTLSDEAIVRNYDILTEFLEADYSAISQGGVGSAVKDRRAMSCYAFETDNTGFSALCNLNEPALMFFSVPYDSGWSAVVNGAPAVIEKANIGFMAVRVPAGETVVRFDYRTPGLVLGIKITFASILALLAYLVFSAITGRKNRRLPAHSMPLARYEETPSDEGFSELAAETPEELSDELVKDGFEVTNKKQVSSLHDYLESLEPLEPQQSEEDDDD